ncbi:MAG TPA: NAD-dependent epimerase/dehydratase family protein [Thermoanaerobaculia bacterium]|nr:NAD-dependent epimerase/dehydratase family protein [Thermoanaerobaculia bacterium]HQR66280.1 NAD-dependent epimerase/dehydratase family protein [Thermoanaerobaculia bacterium]
MSEKPLVALTGGTGFVGSHVADALLARGYRVRALVRRPEAPGWLKGLDLEIVKGDVRDVACLDALVRGADAVVHAAGKTSARSEADYMAANAGGTANVARAAKRVAPNAHVVLVSSLAAAGPSRDGTPLKASAPPRPVSTYGRSKRAGEEELRRAGGLSFTILRPSAVYGPRETSIRDLFVAASKGIVPLLAGGKPRIQLVYALDVAAAVTGALRRGGRGETFFVAHPEVETYASIARTLAALPEKRPVLVPVPAALIRFAGLVVGAATAFSSGPPVFNAEKAEEMLEPAWLCDVSEAQAALGGPFTTDFATGARKTWEWYLENGWVRSDNIAARKRS